jgi:hypothetical protein
VFVRQIYIYILHVSFVGKLYVTRIISIITFLWLLNIQSVIVVHIREQLAERRFIKLWRGCTQKKGLSGEESYGQGVVSAARTYSAF